MKFAIKKSASQFWWCEDPEIVLVATTTAEVEEVLSRVERLQTENFLIAGCISYEAAPAFNQRMVVHRSEDFPLLVMMATQNWQVRDLPDLKHEALELEPRIEQQEYIDRINELIELIRAGDLYQANYSFRSNVKVLGSGFDLFCHLERDHPMPFSGYLSYGDTEVVSLSPELFLQRQGETIRAEPMKGTVTRGKTFVEDETQRTWLQADVKNRAENVMIVDLMRNDLSKICQPGSVSVPNLFQSKRFHSLHQMVSEVQGRLEPGTSLYETLKATFPAGSITGTPKIRAMEVIRDLESSPRKAYTGSLGVFLPGGDFTLNVAIRTLVVDHSGDESIAELGIGSGVVSQSEAEAEWQECLLKGEFLNYRYRHSEIFETMLWHGEYHFLDEHLARLTASCEYFLTTFSEANAKRLLEDKAAEFTGPMRVRLSVTRTGEMQISTSALTEIGWGEGDLRVVISEQPVNQHDPYQFHKTNHRAHYDMAFQAALKSGFAEAVFFNQRCELAEGAISNIFIQKEGRWFTPPVTAGILPGIWRQQMLHALSATETEIDLDALLGADHVMIGNSVRGTGDIKEIWDNDKQLWSKKTVI